MELDGREFGRNKKSETFEEKLEKIERSNQMKNEILNYLDSLEAKEDCKKEIINLFSFLEDKSVKLKESNIHYTFFYRFSDRVFEVKCFNYKLIFIWNKPNTYSLKDSKLIVSIDYFICKDSAKLHDSQYNDISYITSKKKTYKYSKDLTLSELGWSNIKDMNDFISSKQLVEQWSMKFIEKIKEVKEKFE